MATIGDIIVRARKAFPDPCQTLPITSTGTLTQGVTAGGGFSNGNVVYIVVTCLTAWGETTQSPEATTTIGGGNNSVVVTAALPIGTTAARVYVSQQSGAYGSFGWAPLTISGITGTVTLMSYANYQSGAATASNTPGYPPTTNRAYLPDTDGDAVSAFEIFQWLNSALEKMCLRAGGVFDEGGVAWSQSGAEMVLMGRWLKIDTVWWDGWWVPQGYAQGTWLRSLLQSIPGLVAMWGNNENGQVIGQWPQPNSAAAQTTLSSQVSQTDTTFNVVNSGNFRAPGLAQVDNEIFNFSSIVDGGGNNLQFNLLTRGEGGTRSIGHNSGATVTQLICRFIGYRMEPYYHVGDSGLTIQVPPAWSQVLEFYMQARMKAFEQDEQGQMVIDQAFEQSIPFLRASRGGPVGPNQLGSMTPLSSDYEQLAALAGGILIQ